MTTAQLRTALRREISYVMKDEVLMERTLRSLRRARLRREKEQDNEVDEFANWTEEDYIRQAIRDAKLIREGKMECIPFEQMMQELKEESL